MRKLIVLALLSLLFVSGTLQKKRKMRQQKPVNISDVAFPRTFIGHYVIQAESVLNGTQAPISARSPPALQSLSNSSVEYLRGPLSTRVIPIIYMLVVTVGIPANITILGLLLTKIRKVSSAILYASLAISDLLLLFSLLFKAHYHLHGNHWVLGEAACRVITACFYGNLYCSAVTLACISMKRYMAVVHPFTYKRLPKRMLATWVSLAVWGVFLVAIIPELLVQQSFILKELNLTSCHDVLPLTESSHVLLLYYNLALTVLGLLVPLVVTVVCFVKIIRELNHSHFDWTLYIQASSLMFALFVVCFLPAGVLHFLHYVQLFVNGTQSLYIHFNLAVCLCCLHACLDPFLFFIMSKSAGSRLYLMNFKGKTLSVSI